MYQVSPNLCTPMPWSWATSPLVSRARNAPYQVVMMVDGPFVWVPRLSPVLPGPAGSGCCRGSSVSTALGLRRLGCNRLHDQYSRGCGGVGARDWRVMAYAVWRDVLCVPVRGGRVDACVRLMCSIESGPCGCECVWCVVRAIDVRKSGLASVRYGVIRSCAYWGHGVLLG